MENSTVSARAAGDKRSSKSGRTIKPPKRLNSTVSARAAVDKRFSKSCRTIKPPKRLKYDRNFQQATCSKKEPCDSNSKDDQEEAKIDFNYFCNSVPDIMVNILDCLGIQELLTMMQTSHAMLGFAKETRTWKDWTTFTLSYQNCNKFLMFPSRLLYAYHMYEKYENFKSTKKILHSPLEATSRFFV